MFSLGGQSLSQVHGHSAYQDNNEVEANSDVASQDGQGVVSEEFPACVNVEVHKQYLATVDEQRKKIWGDSANYWCESAPSVFAQLSLRCIDLAALAVDPDHRRRGLATMLMNEGLDRADADGLPCYVEASPDGAVIYPRFGFRKVRQHEFFEGKHTTEFHARPAQVKSED